jgi:sugar/nucleoside kinase (ribokinase family)
MTVVVIGDIVTDVVAVHRDELAVGSDTAAEIRITGGGAAANTAAWLAALGVPVTLVAVVGADRAGTDRVEELHAAGVRCVVRRAIGASTGAIVVLSAGGDRTMLVDRGANGLLTAADVVPALAGARHVHLSGYTLLDPATRPAGRAVLTRAAEAGATASVDAASAAPLRSVGGPAFLSWTRPSDLLFANVEEAAALMNDRSAGPAAGSLARRLAAHTGGVAVVKRGAGGAVWADTVDAVAVPGQPASVLDPTGAGDAFAAAVLARWLDGDRPADCLAAGAALGARAVSRVGARP